MFFMPQIIYRLYLKVKQFLRNLNVCYFITNNTAKIQLSILGRTFRLTSGAIANAKKLTLCWVLSHDAKKRETETEPGEVPVGHMLNRWSGKDVEYKLRSGLSC